MKTTTAQSQKSATPSEVEGAAPAEETKAAAPAEDTEALKQRIRELEALAASRGVDPHMQVDPTEVQMPGERPKMGMINPHTNQPIFHIGRPTGKNG